MDLQFIFQSFENQIINPTVFRNVFRECAKLEKKRIKKIIYNFVSDEEILRINKDYLSHDYITDIITFDNSFLDIIEGEVFICYPEVKRNAVRHADNEIEQELNRVILHGLLHLIGYNDHTEEEKSIMHEKETFYLQFF